MSSCNSGVKCDVTECMYNGNSNDCRLHTIEVTKMKTGDSNIDTPHFCKSYEEK